MLLDLTLNYYTHHLLHHRVKLLNGRSGCGLEAKAVDVLINKVHQFFYRSCRVYISICLTQIV